MLEQIPQRAARVFLLSQLDGQSYREICVQLNISEATVKRDMKLSFIACFKIYQEVQS